MKFAHYQVFSTIFICGLITIESSNSTAIHRTGRSRSNCGYLKFRCKNGDCISNELLCDGRADCSDRSDETREECTKHEIVCPDHAFRCNYGACIDGDAKCNGIDDCIDKSDELPPRCNTHNNSPITNTSCSINEFRCSNDQCIPGTALCDGAIDCSDRLDESTTYCSEIECPAFSFRCNYGACIDDNLKCNGIMDCADGSDEDPNLCLATLFKTSTTRPMITRPTTVTTKPTRPSCGIPPQPNNGFWQLYSSQCSSSQHCNVPPNVVEFDPGTHIIYMCNKDYKLNGSRDVFCGRESKWSDNPECVEVRCKPLSTASTEAACTLKNEWISCESPVPPNTVAQVSCRNSYHQDMILSNRRENVRCGTHGQWEPEPIKCSPVCGRINPNATLIPLIANGMEANITEFPWHATLYKSSTPDSKKEFICGATIIQSDLLITAAHCIYDESTRKIEDANKYAVATGNMFLDYDSIINNPAILRKANVKRIYVNCNYLGLAGNYARDIAILQIERPFTFTAYLTPACLDTSMYSDVSILEVGNIGKVAGFGATSSANSSQILQTLNVPYVSFNECKSSSSDSDNEKFITIDKFCGGYTNGSSVCKGDSGGGLVFQTGGLWFLRGVVSVGVSKTRATVTTSCNNYGYALYTKISSHIEWIQDVMLKLEMNHPFPSCSDKSMSRGTQNNMM